MALRSTGMNGLIDHGNEISTVGFEGNSASLFQAEITAKKPLIVKIRISGTLIRRIDVMIENAPPPPWLGPSIQSIGRLMMLPRNWDFDDAPPVHVPSAQSALEGLSLFMTDNTAPPQWTPTRSGGLQVDWHQNGIDLEIAFDCVHPGGYVVLSDLRNQDADWEGPLTSNLEKLRSIAETRLNGHP
jgi:hypothetical protein